MKITTRNDFGLLAQEHFKTGMGAEIGVEYGSNSKQILTQYKGKLICVDMWANEEIYKKAMETLSPLQTTIIRKSSIEAANDIDFGSLDFVYIDADHDYINCKNDIEAWFSKVRNGGIIAGHDYLNWNKADGAGCDFGVKAAVDEFCSENGYTLHVTTDDYWQGNPYQTWWFIKEIPKIIYYTWVNPNPLPDQFKKYIDGWRVLMPEYQIKQISLDNIVKSRFVLEAIKRGLYSVAGHYGRCERLYNTGGIYFDIDIEACKSFNDLLRLPFFVGCETVQRVNNAVIGSVALHPFLTDCLNYMNSIDFDNPGKFGIEIETGPEMFTNIAKKYGWKEIDTLQPLQSGEITVFNSPVFYPYYFDKKYFPGCVTKETYTVHHWAKTW